LIDNLGVGDVTKLLHRLRDGDASASEELMPLVYDNLRRLAAARMREGSSSTLQPTALVHEAYLKLFGQKPPEITNKVHFFALASRVMRQILIDSARAAAGPKRHGGDRVTWDSHLMVEWENGQRGVELLDIHRALEALSAEDERLGRLVEMRYFGGMTAEESAEALNESVHVVRHDLRLAQAWLRRELSR
jgi:RNA polymerase sigma factor (TIGR02999 family)